MNPLSGIDSAFLAVESRTHPMNVVGTLTLEPEPDGPRFDYPAVAARVRRRLPGIAPLRRRLRASAFGVLPSLGLLPQVWEDVALLDAEDHVHLWRIDAPGSTRNLADFVGRIAGRRLDRARPLWELWVVEGLRGGRVGLVFVAHHAVADGISAAALLLQLLGASSADTQPPIPLPLPPCPAPSPSALAVHAAGELTRRPRRAASLLASTVRSVNALGKAGLFDAALPHGAPPTPWNRSISKKRSVAYARVLGKDIDFVRTTFRCSHNDVVLAACTRTLRHYLAASGALPDQPLVATIPVSVRDPKNPDAGNQISLMFSRLPVQISDPVEQLLRIQTESRRAKQAHQLLGGGTAGAWAALVSPGLLAGASRLYSALGLANRHRPLHNLVISNVPGPPNPLRVGSARVVSAHPHGPVMEGAGLNMTVLSYAGSLYFAVLACREAISDPWDLAFGFGAAVGDLVKAALAERGESRQSPAE
jgi:diacylglycerol O-acyltransferase